MFTPLLLLILAALTFAQPLPFSLEPQYLPPVYYPTAQYSVFPSQVNAIDLSKGYQLKNGMKANPSAVVGSIKGALQNEINRAVSN